MCIRDRLETFVKVAEALQVSADYLLRPDVPEVKAIYQGEFAELLEDCSASEMALSEKYLKQVSLEKERAEEAIRIARDLICLLYTSRCV